MLGNFQINWYLISDRLFSSSSVPTLADVKQKVLIKVGNIGTETFPFYTVTHDNAGADCGDVGHLSFSILMTFIKWDTGIQI